MNNQELEQQIYELLSEYDDKKDTKPEWILQQAWDLFPNNINFDDGELSNLATMIAMYFIRHYCTTNQTENAKKWLGIERNINKNGNTRNDLFLGQMHFELGDFEQALHYFKLVYEESGYATFRYYDKKYWQFFKQAVGKK